jgi:mRNA interferase RelE/StbE
MSWAISYRSSVEKDIARLPSPVRGSVLKKMVELAHNPFPAGCKKLKGSVNCCRLRVAGEYRIVYSVLFSQNAIQVEFVGHRKDAYRWF